MVAPVLRLVVAAEELPVLRLVCAEEVLPLERVVPLWLLELEEPRLVRVFWAMELAERDAEAPLDRLGLVEVVCEEDDRVAVEEPPEERRDWASASGAAIIAIVMKRAATVLIILLMALSFKS